MKEPTMGDSFIEGNTIQLRQRSANQNNPNNSFTNNENNDATARTLNTDAPAVNNDILIDYKNYWDFFRIAIILSISSLSVGYSLAQVAVVPNQVMINAYKIPLSQNLTHAFLMGIWPLGGIFGLLLCFNLVKVFKKRTIYLLMEPISIILTILMQIQTFPTLLIGRFMLGILCGMYPMLASVLTKQIVPISLLSIMGTFFSLGRTFGLVLCFAVGVIFQPTQQNQYYRIIFAIPGILSIIQTLTIHFFVPDPAIELIAREQEELLDKTIRKYYKEERVERVVLAYRKNYEFIRNKASEVVGGEDPLKGNKLRAFLMAININIYTNSCGVNTTFLLANSVMDKLVPSLALYVNLIVNSTRIPVSTYASLSLVKKIGRRPLFLMSSFILTACNFGIAFGYLANGQVAILVLIFIFTIVFGLLYNPVMITYPAEIIPADKFIVVNIFNQISMMVSLFIPPLVLSAAGGNGFGLFIFFGVYSGLSFAYMFFYLKQSKGLKYEQIVASF